MRTSSYEAVKVRNLTKKFGSVTAVDNVSLDIDAGKFTTLLGPSGCGKTTLLRLIAGLETPTEGQVLLGERDITFEPANQRNTIMVFQSYALFPHMTVDQNVGYGLKLARTTKKTIQQDVAEVLEMMGMKGLGHRYIGELSGGQQQRVALARAVVMKPKVLLFDEPLSNLDAKLRKKMRLELRALQQELGITSIYVTHDQIEALAMSDSIVVMNNGVAEQKGTPREIYAHPKTAFIADFIGEANLIKATAVSATADHAVFDLQGQRLVLPLHGLKAGESGTLMIRPETFILHAESARLELVVETATYLGNFVEYELRLGEQRIVAVDYERTDQILGAGETIKVDFRTQGLHFISN